jgi:hypothetical protein
MSQNLIDYNKPLLKNIINTTWQPSDNSDWVIELSVDFSSNSTKDINAWYKESMIKTLDAFSELIRIWKVALIPSPESVDNIVVIDWQQEESYQEYLENVNKQIELYPSTIEEIELKIDLQVFVETSDCLDSNPTFGWIRYGDEIIIRAEDGNPYLYLSLKHTLFAPFTLELEEDNNKLHLLNQPFLEKSLKSWEKNFGSISEYDGSPKVYKYGFKPDEEWDKS